MRYERGRHYKVGILNLDGKRSGVVWRGGARFGQVRSGLVRCGPVRRGRAREVVRGD